MPAWLIQALTIAQEALAALLAIIQAAEGKPTPAQMTQIAAYSAMIHGINQAVAYHVKA